MSLSRLACSRCWIATTLSVRAHHHRPSSDKEFMSKNVGFPTIATTTARIMFLFSSSHGLWLLSNMQGKKLKQLSSNFRG
jgi:hypothetical protein